MGLYRDIIGVYVSCSLNPLKRIIKGDCIGIMEKKMEATVIRLYRDIVGILWR